MNFNYRARDKYGKLVTGAMEVASLEACSEKLHQADLVPIQINAPSFTEKLSRIFEARVKPDDLNGFTRQLATLQQSGIPLLSGIRSLELQNKNPLFRKIIRQIASDLENGESLHEALSRHPSVFDQVYVNMVKAGEVSGNLDTVLDRVAELNEKNTETQGKITSALRYPALTLMSMVGAFLVIVTFVVPRFALLFSRFDAELPLPTRMLMSTYHVISHYWWGVLMVLAALIYLFRLCVKTQRGRYHWHSCLLKLPVIGALLHEIYMSRFSVNLAMLLDSGLPILQSLEMVGQTVQNAVLRQAIEYIRQEVSEGRGMAEPMAKTNLFTPMVTQMIGIGEETGRVSHLLRQVARYYDRESDFKIKNLTTLIEPFFIVVMGIMVLFLALGVYLPMWNIVNLFKG